MKKITLLFICILSALSINATVYSGSCGDNVKYSLDTSTGLLSITGTGAMNNYNYYSSVPWYSNRSYVKTVEISDGVTSIGGYAFYYCSDLTSVTIPNSVTSIGERAFSGTAWYNNQPDGLVYAGLVAYTYKGTMPENTSIIINERILGIGEQAFYGCSKLTSIEIPNSVTSIGESAFQYCSGLTSVTIGNSVTSIGEQAFYGCSKLTSIEIPNSVTSIGESVFQYCSGLTSVTIPNSVTSIGSSAFSGCSGLTSISVENGNKKYDSRNNCNAIVETASNTLIVGCNNTTIPNSVTSIGGYAFYNCSKLTSITIPNSVTSIGPSAFSGCSGLTSVTIPNSVTSIGGYAFYNCSKLTSITIPNSVTSIEDYAFGDCYFEKKNFINNSSLDAEANNYWGATIIDSRNDGFVIKDGTLLKYTGNVASVTIPNSVTSIGSSAFYGCSGLTSVTIPNSVMSIGSSAFYGCSGLTSVTIPNSVRSIGGYAFRDCSDLTKVILNSNAIASKSYSYDSTLGSIFGSQVKEYVLGESVTSIGNYAFYNCDNLTSVTIGNSVKRIGFAAFKGCSKLTSVTIPNSVTSIGNCAFEGCSGLTSVTIGNSVTSIGGFAFSGCSGLTSVTIPNSVTSIGGYAFEGCSNLTSVTIPNSVTSIGDFAFGDCYFEKKNFINNSSLDAEANNYWGATIIDSENDEFVIKDGTLLKYTGNVASVTIPNSVTSIGSSAFYGCSGLTSVTIPNSVMSIGSSAFYGCSGLTSVTIPNSVRSIGENAFDGCSGLTSIEIPNSVTSIGSSAFYSCSGLTKVTLNSNAIASKSYSSSSTLRSIFGSQVKEYVLGESVTSIGNYAFYNCDSLTSVTIPNSVTNIGNDTFNSCENLIRVSINSNTIIGTDDISLYGVFGSQVKEYILGNDVKSIGGGKFSGCTDLAYITIPNSVKTIGNSAFHNCSKLEYITIPNSVTSIGDYALSDCANLKSVTIGSGVQVIGKDVFENHRPAKVFWLTNTPPEGYTYAEGTINYVSNRQYTEFSNVIRYSSLSSIFVVDGIKYVPVSPSERTCDAIDCTYDDSIETINIGEKVTNRGIALSVKQVCPYTCFDNKYIKEINLSFKGDIGAKAFYGCSNMTKAELGDNILSIGESGFSKCSKLESIVIPDSVVSINDSTFCDCIALDTVKIGKGVDNIGRYAFSGCSVLPNIKIPQSVASIADYAFRGCIGMKTVVMSNGDSELALSSNGSNPLFVDCPLDSVYIGRNILYETSADYGYSPFCRNRTLRTVVITDKETEISENEFYGCTNLQSFKVGDGVTYFGSWAFSGCSSLKSLSFGSQLRIIGQEAFSDCNSVTVIVSKTERPPICDNQALEDINKWDCKLYVPEGTLSAYQAANQWKDFFFMEEGNPFANPRGDANGDGEVNIDDATFVANIILGTEEATEAADVNKDGVINMSDVMFIVNYIKNGEFPDE